MITKKKYIEAVIWGAEHRIAFENKKPKNEIERAKRLCIKIRKAEKVGISKKGRLVFS